MILLLFYIFGLLLLANQTCHSPGLTLLSVSPQNFGGIDSHNCHHCILLFVFLFLFKSHHPKLISPPMLNPQHHLVIGFIWKSEKEKVNFEKNNSLTPK